jgi:hypothetical protein
LLVATWPPPATLILNTCPSSLTTCQLVSDSAASTGSPHDKVEESSRVDVVPNEKLYHLDIEMLNLPFDNSFVGIDGADLYWCQYYKKVLCKSRLNGNISLSVYDSHFVLLVKYRRE